jgi:hypothetical protein
MPTISQDLTLLWQSEATALSAHEINLLFEIFGPFPITNQFTVRSGLIGLGKSRILIADQDQLSDALYNYINQLSMTQQIRVKELIGQWEDIGTKVIKFDSAERVRFRVNAPEEARKLILKRIQTYIPLYRADEIEGNETGAGDNTILRG